MRLADARFAASIMISCSMSRSLIGSQWRLDDEHVGAADVLAVAAVDLAVGERRQLDLAERHVAGARRPRSTARGARARRRASSVFLVTSSISSPFRRASRLGVVASSRARPSRSSIRAGTPFTSAPGGTSWVTTAPGAGVRTVAELDRRDQRPCWTLVCTPSPTVVRCLFVAVVVGGDRAGAEVGAGADLGVADVGEVRDLRALADLGVLDLDERADLARRPRGGCPAGGTRTARPWQSSPISALARDGVATIARARRRRCRRGGCRGRSTEPAPIDRAALEDRAREAAARRARARPSRRCRCAPGRPS